jgi:nitrogen fixation protein NifU and related proteins
MSDLRSLYEAVILDHNRHPRNYPHRPEGANVYAHGFNPVCGDEFRVHALVENGRIEDIGFEGGGCAIATASASIMTVAVKGKSVAEAEALLQKVHAVLIGTAPADEMPGSMKALLGVREFPIRIKCATLAWHTLHSALQGKRSATTEHEPVQEDV